MRSLGALLTQRGSAFLTAGAILLLAGLLLGQPDLTRIGALLLALLAGALWLGRRRPSTFSVTRTSSPGRLTVDEPTLVVAALLNEGNRPSTFALAEEHLDPSLGDRPRFVIPPTPAGNVREVEYFLRPHVRGVHQLGPLHVWVRDPFGLTSNSRPSQGSGSVVVAPRIHPLTSEGALGRGVGAEGSIPHQVALHGEDDQSIREYREGDDLRRIHWPATARTGALMVRQEDRPARRRAVILLDSHALSGAPSPFSPLPFSPSSSPAARQTTPRFEWAVTMAASVAGHVLERGYAVHLLTSDPAADSGVRQDDDLDAMLDTLARIRLRSDTGMAQVIQAAHGLAHDGGVLVVLTPGMTEEDARGLATLRPPGSTGFAFVARAGNRSEDRLTDTTLAVLSASGWRAVGVRSGDSPMQAWSSVTASAVGGVT